MEKIKRITKDELEKIRPKLDLLLVRIMVVDALKT